MSDMYFGLSQPQTSMFGLVIGSNKKIRLELGLHPIHNELISAQFADVNNQASY